MNEDIDFKNLDFSYRTGEAEDFDEDYEEENLHLGFIKFVGSNHEGLNQYEFIFTIYPSEFWGINYEYKPCGICNGIIPDEKYIQEIKTIKTDILFDLIQDSGCFSMQDCMDGIVSLAWENLDSYEEYPEYRIFFNFGENMRDVEKKLALKRILWERNEN